MEHPSLPPFYKTGELAELFLVSHRTIVRWALEGRLLWGRSPGGHFRFPANQPLIIRRLEELNGRDR